MGKRRWIFHIAWRERSPLTKQTMIWHTVEGELANLERLGKELQKGKSRLSQLRPSEEKCTRQNMVEGVHGSHTNQQDST